MSSTFPRADRGNLGYNVKQVEDFLLEARVAYNAADSAESMLSAEAIRHAAFSMQRGGYATHQVDAALARLEEAFAERERDQLSREVGRPAWMRQARHHASEITERLARPRRHRFRRVSFLTMGYHLRDVDRFGDRLVRHFRDGEPLHIDEVRTAMFRPQRGGYLEAQVDMLMDATVDVLLAIR